LETLIEVATRVDLISVATKDAIDGKCGDVGRLLLALIAYLRRKKASLVNEAHSKYDLILDTNDIWIT
jgi:hypothetical protein